LDNIDSGLDLLVSSIQVYFENAIENVFIPVLIGGGGLIFDEIISIIISVLVTSMNLLGGVFGLATLGDDISSIFDNFTSAFGVFGVFFDIIMNNLLPTVLAIFEFIAEFSDEGIILIFIIAGFDIVFGLLDGNFEVLTKYMRFLAWVGEKMFSIVNMVVTFIGGIIP